MDALLEAAHKHSRLHRGDVLGSNLCGCFFCLNRFAPVQIVDWCDDGGTAICPRCGIDSVLGDKSGVAVTEEFLAQMKRRWFGAGEPAGAAAEGTLDPEFDALLDAFVQSLDQPEFQAALEKHMQTASSRQDAGGADPKAGS
jgi:hypothetical protein